LKKRGVWSAEEEIGIPADRRVIFFKIGNAQLIT
jgi:hypothetical protein